MSDLLKVVALLKDKLTCEVFTGQIPENYSNSAIAVNNVANPFTRTLSGRKVRTSSTWRITVVAKEQSDVEYVMDELNVVDNH